MLHHVCFRGKWILLGNDNLLMVTNSLRVELVCIEICSFYKAKPRLARDD